MAGRSLSRRAMLRGFLPEVTRHVEEEIAKTAPPPRRRPPGAVVEEKFLELCTGCTDCRQACPEAAIHSLAEWVVPGAGTPLMVPEDRPCLMCDGFPCVSACTTGALVMPETSVVRLGTVVLDPSICLPFMGPECGACARLCPEGASGALTMRLARPTIHADLCVGCGRCIEACPTSPKALTMVPLEEPTEA